VQIHCYTRQIQFPGTQILNRTEDEAILIYQYNVDVIEDALGNNLAVSTVTLVSAVFVKSDSVL